LIEHKEEYPWGSHFLDDVALWAHTTDLRPDNSGTCVAPIPQIASIKENGHCLPGFQNLTLYTLYAFGGIDGREILMQASRQGGYDYDPKNPKTLDQLATESTQPCTSPGNTTGIPDAVSSPA